MPEADSSPLLGGVRRRVTNIEMQQYARALDPQSSAKQSYRVVYVECPRAKTSVPLHPALQQAMKDALDETRQPPVKAVYMPILLQGIGDQHYILAVWFPKFRDASFVAAINEGTSYPDHASTAAVVVSPRPLQPDGTHAGKIGPETVEYVVVHGSQCPRSRIQRRHLRRPGATLSSRPDGDSGSVGFYRISTGADRKRPRCHGPLERRTEGLHQRHAYCTFDNT